MKLPAPIRIKASGLRPRVATIKEGIRLIDDDLAAELRALPRWTFARSLIVVAERSGKKRDLLTAFRQIKQALMEEGWLAE